MFDLTGRVSVVTGGGSGIGRAISIALARHGSVVVILDVDMESATQVKEEIADTGGTALSYDCDVGDQRSVKRVFDRLVRDAGQLNVLVNNAGVADIGTAESTTEERFDSVFRVNVKGVYNCLHAGIPHLRSAGGGSIVNIASVAASVGIPDRFAYSMTKGAVVTMTYSVARDFVSDGIRCNSVSPARVHTPFVDGYLRDHYPGQEDEMFDRLSKTQPVGRMGQPEEIASLVSYLASDEASFVTGTDFPIDGGFLRLNT